MNKKDVTKLHKEFARLAAALGAEGDGSHHDYSIKIGKPDERGYYDRSYGYHVQTRYGLLTFRLDAEAGRGERITVFAKFLEPEKLPFTPPCNPFKYVHINALQANTYHGKWNLHLGVMPVDDALYHIAIMFDPAGLLEQVPATLDRKDQVC